MPTCSFQFRFSVFQSTPLYSTYSAQYSSVPTGYKCLSFPLLSFFSCVYAAFVSLKPRKAATSNYKLTFVIVNDMLQLKFEWKLIENRDKQSKEQSQNANETVFVFARVLEPCSVREKSNKYLRTAGDSRNLLGRVKKFRFLFQPFKLKFVLTEMKEEKTFVHGQCGAHPKTLPCSSSSSSSSSSTFSS